MIQLAIVYSVVALKVLPGQLLFYLGIFSKGFFLKTVESSLPTPLHARYSCDTMNGLFHFEVQFLDMTVTWSIYDQEKVSYVQEKATQWETQVQIDRVWENDN